MKRVVLYAGLLTVAANAYAQTTAPASTALHAQADAEDALARQDYAGALRQLDLLVATSPKDAVLLYDRGFAHEALNDDVAAEKDYRASIALNALLFEPHLSLGLLLARAGQDGPAREQLSFAVTQAKTPTALELKGRAYRALAQLDAAQKPEDARDELLAALKFSPETADDRLLSAEIASRLGTPSDAEAAYRSVLARSPGDPTATAALAHMLLQQQKAAEAQELLEASINDHPNDEALTSELASALVKQDKATEALPLIKPLHAAHPEDAALTRLLARLDQETGDYTAAAPLYADLLKATPNDAGLLDDYASALIHLQRGPEARTLLERAVAMGPDAFASKEDYGAAASHLAFAASEAKDAAACLHALQLRATVLPETPSSLFLAATAHDELHQKPEAIALYKQFLTAAQGKYPDQEFQARHRIIALAH